MSRQRIDLTTLPDLPEARARLLTALAVPDIDDPIKALHDSIHATDSVLVADDGWRYESLFHSFVSSDNPNWDRGLSQSILS